MPKRVLQPADMPVPQNYTNGILVSDTAYIAGQIGIDAEGNCPPDAHGQSVQAFKNIAKILAEADMTLSDIVRMTVYLTDLEDYADYSKARIANLGDHKPASTLVVVASLVRPHYKVEIEVTAAR